MRFVARSFNMQRKLPRSQWSLLLWAVDHLTGWWQWWDYLSLVRFIFTSVTKMSRRLKWLSCWKRWRRVFHRLLFLVKWEACKVSFTWIIVLEIKNSGKPRKWKNLGLFDSLIRELTSLQSFQPLIGVLFIPKTSLKKWIRAASNFYALIPFISFTSSNVGKCFWSWILKDCIKKFRKRKRKLLPYVLVSNKTWI